MMVILEKVCIVHLLKLHVERECSAIYIATELAYHSLDQLVWVAARCTSAAPVYFKPYNQYVDGGVKANNPSPDALTRIQEYYRRYRRRQNYKITSLVSLGCGRFDQKRKNMGALDFIHHWKNFSWWRPFLGTQNIASSISGLLDVLLTEVGYVYILWHTRVLLVMNIVL